MAGRPGGINNGNINIGNDINIGGGSNVIGNSKPWSPDPGPLPAGQGTKPGLATYAARRPGRCRWTRGPGGIGGGVAPAASLE